MGHIAGIVIDQGITDIQELEKQLNCSFMPADSSSGSQKCEVYFSKGAVLIKTEPEITLQPIGIREGMCLSFLLSDTTDGYTYGLCIGRKVLKAFKSMGGERIEEHGSFTEAEKEQDPYVYITDAIKSFCGTDLFDLINEVPSQTYGFSLTPIDVEFPAQEQSTPQQSVKRKQGEKKVSVPIADPENMQRSDELYRLLLSDDADEVLAAVSAIQATDINTHTFAYLLVLSRFHWDNKVRREAKKVILRYADDDFIDTYNEHWNNKYKATQGYHEIKAYYEDDRVKTEEYFLFAYANRRKYYDRHPVRGMYNTYNRLTDDKDDIKNVFECHGTQVYEVPNKVVAEQQIRVARIMGAPNLHLVEAITLFSHLPDLHNLRLWWCGIDKLPKQINSLPNLQRLGLRGNFLKSIPKDVFLPNLIFLDIGDNGITELDLSCFPKLEYLSVSSGYNITFKNVTTKLTVGYGKIVYEEVEPE